MRLSICILRIVTVLLCHVNGTSLFWGISVKLVCSCLFSI